MNIRQRLEQLEASQRSELARQLGLASTKKQVLSAFVAGDRLPAENELRSFLAQQLPRYMLPARITALPELPRNKNGKVDRGSLRQAALPAPVAGEQQATTETERHLIVIWQEILGQAVVNRADNFFDLGGDSLRAMSLFSKLENDLGVVLPLESIFEHPTVAELAQLIRPQSEVAEHPGIVVLQKGKGLTPLFCIHNGFGNVFQYRQFAGLLGKDRPVLALSPSGLDGKSERHTTVEQMATCYVQRMIEAFPDGPYLICGTSFGGSIAYEVSRQLHESGRDVPYTGLLDTSVYGTLSLNQSLADHQNRLAQLTLMGKLLHLGKSIYGNLRTLVRRSHRRLKDLGSLVPARVALALGRPIPVKYQPIYLGKLYGSAMYDYVPRSHPGPVTVYKHEHETWEYRDHPDLGWGPFVPPEQLEVLVIQGQHGDMMTMPLVQDIAASVNEKIARY